MLPGKHPKSVRNLFWEGLENDVFSVNCHTLMAGSVGKPILFKNFFLIIMLSLFESLMLNKAAII